MFATVTLKQLCAYGNCFFQALDKRKKGYKYIEKPRPNKSLKMRKGFSLKADVDTAKIQPKV